MNCSVKFLEPTFSVCAEAALPKPIASATAAIHLPMLPIRSPLFCVSESLAQFPAPFLLFAGSREAQFLADAEPGTLFDHGVGERDVGERQPAMPEEDGFVVALAAGPEAGDDLAHLGMQGLLRQLAGVDMRAQAAERAALALAPIVDDELVGDVGQGQLDGAHRAVGHDEAGGLDPLGL